MNEETIAQPVPPNQPKSNLRYNPNWTLTGGKYAGTKISMLPTEYLKEMIEESIGYRKTFFERALNERYLEFVAEGIKLSSANAKDGILPDIPELAVILKQEHDQVDGDRFVDYIYNIAKQIFAGKLKVVINEETKQ